MTKFLFKIIDLKQGSPEWLAWRKSGIGASESAALLGLCPYNTALDVYKDKKNPSYVAESNFAMQRGSDTEGKARAKYELVTMEDMPPICATSIQHEFLNASLDGIRSDLKKICEIKVPGKDSHANAKLGKVPEHYMIQIQHQLLVTGADECDYFSYSYVDGSHALVTVKADKDLQLKILEACIAFKKCLDTNTPPPLTDRDVKEITGNEAVAKLCKELKLFAGAKGKKEYCDELKRDAIALGGHPKIKCDGVQISTVLKDGQFWYHKLTIAKDAVNA